MLNGYLDEAIMTLEELIEITKQDILNIKEAKHSLVYESVRKKGLLIKKFEETKRNIDKELVKISQTSSSIAETLDDEAKSKLVTMRERLESLNEVNKKYAKHVVVVKEFFDSLTKEMFDIDSNTYSKNLNTNTLYKAKV
ncbi:flagellar biosynthesis protein FlgN [Campylobacter pinnipediorum]|uniref:flagellar biosynthesis protein FlgN n=1 Tax=Campylobacter pinnipediorum TaxID=1965231 RepID=UPI00084D314F|nr:flagellar biosynthesis protein FlgN [Campylobacter pinnipediorum]